MATIKIYDATGALISITALDDILAKLSDDPATETTLSAIAASVAGTLAVNAKNAAQTTTTATISNGGSLSAAVDLGTGRPVRIVMPAAWDAASITLQSSADNVTFNNVYDEFGSEVTIQAAASRAIILDPAKYFALGRYIKLRSGTSGTAVNQTADRTITIALAP